MLSYNYWMREENMSGSGFVSYVRGDIAIAYIFTAIFGGSIMLIANDAFFTQGVALKDAEAVPRMAAALGTVLGQFGTHRVFRRLLGRGVRVAARRVAERALSLRRLLRHRLEDVAGGEARSRQGDEHAVSAGAGLHLAGADSVCLHRPADPDRHHLYDRQQPVRAVRGRHRPLPQQPRAVERGRCRKTRGSPTCCSSRSSCSSHLSARRK